MFRYYLSVPPLSVALIGADSYKRSHTHTHTIHNVMRILANKCLTGERKTVARLIWFNWSEGNSSLLFGDLVTLMLMLPQQLTILQKQLRSQLYIYSLWSWKTDSIQVTS